MSRLRSLAALSAAERTLSWRAVWWLVVFRMALVLVPFPRIRAWMDARLAARHRSAAVASPMHAWAVRRALSRAARTFPSAPCLPQALAAEWLLRAQGVAAVLRIGVAPAAGDGRPIDAHAWVESDGLVVVGDAEFARFAALAAYSSAP